jgi:hypothetical protein
VYVCLSKLILAQQRLAKEAETTPDAALKLRIEEGQVIRAHYLQMLQAILAGLNRHLTPAST